MTVPTTSPDDLRQNLADLGLAPGAHVAIHSRLLSFGHLLGGIAPVYDMLSKVIGATGTIIVPTYTLDQRTIYDPDKTPSQGVGMLPEYVLAQPGRMRSICPMHNHAGMGARAEVLSLSDGRVSFGPGSDFEFLLEADFQLLLLGTGLVEGASFIHHIEATASVPYRQWMTFQRQCIDSHGQLITTSCQYFGRPDDSRVEENFDILEPDLLAAGIMRRVDTHFGASRLIRLRDLFDFGMSALQRDPYRMVKMS